MTHPVTAHAPVCLRALSRDDLSFLKRRGRGAAGPLAHDHWAVRSTGHYGLDCRVGGIMAAELRRYLADTRDVCILSDIVKELMTRPADPGGDGIVVGFFTELGMDLLRAARPEGRQ